MLPNRWFLSLHVPLASHSLDVELSIPRPERATRRKALTGLRGRVDWHSSDRLGGTVRARESGQTAA